MYGVYAQNDEIKLPFFKKTYTVQLQDSWLPCYFHCVHIFIWLISQNIVGGKFLVRYKAEWYQLPFLKTMWLFQRKIHFITL